MGIRHVSITIAGTKTKFRRQQGKGAYLKTGVTRKQRLPNFPKNKHFLPRDTHTCVE